MLLPQLDYRLTWDEWLRVTFEIQQKLAEKYDSSNACALETINIEAYLVNLAKGHNKIELLDDVSSKSHSSLSSAIASYFLGKGSRATVDNLLQDESDYIKCQTLIQLIVHSKLSKKNGSIESDKDTVMNSDSTLCASAREWTKILDAYEPKGTPDL